VTASQDTDERPRTGKTSTGRLPRSARRNQLLGAAEEVFVAQGYHAAAMDDIAERAGVSKPVLYQHFPGKLELYLALLDKHCDALVEAIRGALEATTDNKLRVQATTEAYFAYVAAESGAFRLVFESDLTNETAVRERVEAVKAIWTTDEASYLGEYVNFDRIWSWPKPAQRPHPPVIVGGEGPTVFDRVLAFGDAWMPNHGPSDLIKRSAELRLRADRHISLQVMGVPADPSVFEAYAAEGFDRVVHWLPSAGRGPVERALDGYESAIAEFTGEGS